MLALSHQNSALLTTTSAYLLILLTCVATWSSISRKNLFFYFNCVLLSYYRPMTLTVRGRRKDSREKQKKLDDLEVEEDTNCRDVGQHFQFLFLWYALK